MFNDCSFTVLLVRCEVGLVKPACLNFVGTSLNSSNTMKSPIYYSIHSGILKIININFNLKLLSGFRSAYGHSLIAMRETFISTPSLKHRF